MNEVMRTLRGREYFLRLVADNVRDAIWVLDIRNLCYIYANSYSEEIFGIPPERYIGSPVGINMDAKTRREARRIIADELANDHLRDPGRSLLFVGMETEKRQGRGVWTETKASFVRDDSGKPVAILGVTRDITERKRMEEALRERYEFENLVTAIATRFINIPSDEIDGGIRHALRMIGAFARVDRCHIVLFSDDMRTITGAYEWRARGIAPGMGALKGASARPLRWLLGRHARFETVHVPRVDDLPVQARGFRCFVGGMEAKSLVSVPLVLSGRLIGFFGFDSVREYKSWSDDIIALLRIVGEIFVNLFERRKADQELSLYRRIVAHTKDQMVFADSSMVVRAANEEFIRAFDLRKEDAVGRPLAELFGSGWSDEVFGLSFQSCLSGGEIFFEQLCEYPVPGLRYMEISMYPFRGARGREVEGVIINLRDITERLKVEGTVLAAAQRERQRIGMDLHDGVSHNLLGVAIRCRLLYARLKERSIGEEEEALAVENGINRAIQDVRTLARGLLPLVGEKENFRALLEEMAREMKERYSIDCVIAAPRSFQIDDATVSTQLYYIISEALANVVKHAGARRVVITFHRRKDLLALEVSDDGAGMSAGTRESAGLGLSLMKHRARLIGGTLSVRKGRGGGTEVACKFRLKGPGGYEQKGGGKNKRAQGGQDPGG
ncbi:MAG: PAS domain-containing protein [Spirochaetes bacterium]|nr:PAS domain-containing protein [Spirochaetota bacterium]